MAFSVAALTPKMTAVKAAVVIPQPAAHRLQVEPYGMTAVHVLDGELMFPLLSTLTT
jgi:hypothetical protein